MTDRATLEANREIGRRVLLEIWSEGRLDVADELYAPGYVDHVNRGPEPAEVHGAAGLKEAVTLFRTAFPDLRYTVDDDMAERDLVMTRFSARGTHRGPFLGAAPTGKAVAYTGIDVNRIVAGRIVESWVHYDALGLLQQVGLVPPTPGT
ncbi:MAG TPA: ester cyclase [Acidimicrobiia bacterium]